jgi:hypothetical protein
MPAVPFIAHLPFHRCKKAPVEICRHCITPAVALAVPHGCFAESVAILLQCNIIVETPGFQGPRDPVNAWQNKKQNMLGVEECG